MFTFWQQANGQTEALTVVSGSLIINSLKVKNNHVGCLASDLHFYKMLSMTAVCI